MPKIAFSDLTVRALKPGVYFDAKTPAFGLRVGKNRRTWIVLKGARSIKVRLGHYPTLSLADARKKALIALGSPYAPSAAPTFPEALALRQLQAHGAKKVAERQDEIFRKWIEGVLPKVNPEGHAFSKAELSELLAFCERNEAAFYAACPAMIVEDALTRARTATPNRNPKSSDGIDLMHAVVALAYCDYFLVRDGFVFQCCEHVSKELSGMKLATVYRDAEELRKALA